MCSFVGVNIIVLSVHSVFFTLKLCNRSAHFSSDLSLLNNLISVQFVMLIQDRVFTMIPAFYETPLRSSTALPTCGWPGPGPWLDAC